MQSVFVSRENERARLHGFLERAVAGQGQICFVTGEGGSGKTSLNRRFAQEAQAAHESLLIATGNCNAQTGIGDPYLPFREMLALLAGHVDEQSRQDAVTAENAGRVGRFLKVSKRVISDLGPDLVDILVPGAGIATKVGKLVVDDTGLLNKMGLTQAPEPAVGLRALTNAEQTRIFEQYTAVLRALSQERPLALMLDDLQWIDESSASLLFHLARRIGGSRILIIASYRPEDLALGRGEQRHPLAPVLAELKREFGDVEIPLGDGYGNSAREFVDALLDSEPNRLGASFRQLLARRTHGHPLFTAELLRTMRERGDLTRDADGHWIEGPDLDWDVLPARVEGAIEERIRRLPPDLQELLSIASVEGEVFTAEVVAKLTRSDTRQVVRRLTQELDRMHALVREEGRERVGAARLSRFRFRHNFFQTYLYDTLGDSEREVLHEDVADALETLHEGHTAEISVQLARHYEAAQSLDKAAYHCLQAGRRAMAVFAHGEAVALAARGLRALEALPDTTERRRQKLELMLLAGNAQRMSGTWAESMQTFREAAELAERAGLPEVMAEAALGYEHPRYRYNLPETITRDLLGRALAALPNRDSSLRVRVLAGLARATATTSTGLSDAAVRMADEAVAMARRLDDPQALLEALEMRFLFDRAPSEIHRRLETMDEMLGLARRGNDKRLLLDILEMRYMDRMALGEREAGDFIDEHARLADEIKDPFYLYTTASIRVCPAFLAGRFDEAEQLAQQAFQIGQQHGIGSAQGIFGIHMFTFRREQGRLREIAPVVQHFLREQGHGAAWQPGLALIYSDLGRLDDARTEFERLAANDFAAVPRDALWQTCLAYLAEVCSTLGDGERAARLYELMLPYAELNVLVGLDFYLGASGRYLGQLAAVGSRWEVAEAHFEHGLQLDERTGATPWLAHSRYQYGRMLRLRGRPEDRERAEALIGQALATGRALGMHGLVGRIEASAGDGG
jgi:tetratricopeptide (TPR) repeat protein